MDRYSMFSRGGDRIEILRTTAERSWALVTETSARFPLSIFDSKCNRFVLNWGNILLIENSDGLPPWVGMIDLIGFDRGYAIVYAFTPERFFLYRRGPRKLTLTGSAGEIFVQMIRYINGLQPTVLQVGDIESNTGSMQETLNPVPIDANLRRIVQRSGEGYRWRPEVSNGSLVIFCDWFPDLSLETGLILQDGYNISNNHPLTLSPPVNDYLAYGVGSDWATRQLSIAQDAESIEDYGLRQASDSINSKIQADLDIVSTTLINAYSQPRYSFPIEALNEGDTFQKLRPGALATFTKLVGQGFSNLGSGYMSYDKIINVMDYNPAAGIVGLGLNG